MKNIISARIKVNNNIAFLLQKRINCLGSLEGGKDRNADKNLEGIQKISPFSRRFLGEGERKNADR